MKAAPFAYSRPGTVEEVVTELARDDAKVIAGGQSLVPVLAMRLGRPAQLVDVNAVPELNALTRDGDVVPVGATVRQRQMERSELAAVVPLVRMALPWVGHREIRSRGTVCGSIAHADPPRSCRRSRAAWGRRWSSPAPGARVRCRRRSSSAVR